MKISKGIEDNGIIQRMIGDGYSDLVFITENEEIPSISLFMCYFNERLRKIIQDPKVEKRITLPDKITKRAFMLLSCYYGYGTIDINEENVCDCCICLDEQKLMNICLRYIRIHPSKEIVASVLKLLYFIPKYYLYGLKTSLQDYIQINCCEILNDEKIIKTLFLDDLKFIISIENIIVPSEKYLLDKILFHYKNHLEKKLNNEISKEEEKSKYDETMKLLNWKEINIGEINPDDMELIDLNMMYKNKNENKHLNRIYCEEPQTGNKILDRMIRRGIRELTLMKDDEIKEEKVKQNTINQQPLPQTQLNPHYQQPPLTFQPLPPPFQQPEPTMIQPPPLPSSSLNPQPQPLFNFQQPTVYHLPQSNDDDDINDDDDESNIRQIISLDLLDLLLKEVKRTKSAIEILIIFKLSKKIKMKLFDRLSMDDKIKILKIIYNEYKKKNEINNKNRIIELYSYFVRSNEELDILYKSNGSEILSELYRCKYVKNKNIFIGFIRMNIPNPESILNQINN